ncbi:MAG: Rpp14/Pop5 family protein [Candidatus Pacearchaeota archaeon]
MPLKPLKPSMKENKRYLLLKGNFTKKDVEEAILKFIGVLGYAKAAPVWITNNILAVNREYVNQVRGSFILVNSGKSIEVVRVSGTLKKLREKTKS